MKRKEYRDFSENLILKNIREKVENSEPVFYD